MPDRYVVIGEIATVAASPEGNKRAGRRPGPGVRLALGLLAGLAPGCAAPGSELHLEPLYARIHTADGGTSNEALGGLFRDRRGAEDDFLEWRTIAPFWGVDRRRNGDWVAHHPWPLGWTSKRGEDRFSRLLPFYLWWSRPDADGVPGWKLFSLPGLLMEGGDDGFKFGWFPFFGQLRDFLTYDRLLFVMWPLFVYSERAGRISYNVPWPILGWTYGNGERSHHLWPLYMKASIEGTYDRLSLLWPLFHFQKNYVAGDTERPETTWMLFPLVGRKTRESYHSTTLLWPLFGYARDRESDFWALDAPFPLVRFQRSPDVHRSRVWPLFSYVDADDLRTLSFLWPLIQIRHEDGPGYVRDSTYVVPVWASATRRDAETGQVDRWRKLWPLFEYETDGAWRHGIVPQVNPLRRAPLLHRFLTRPLHLWEWEQEGEMRRERAWLGLYRREKGRGEDRRSLTFLWSRRKYSAEGADIKETSLLFGLLRWRTGDGGFRLLRPAFPGPGWPEPAGSHAPGGSRRRPARSYF